MARLVAYDVAGWGVGELWLEEDVPVWHDLPTLRPAGTGARAEARPAHALAERLADYFAGARDDFGDVPLDLDWCTPFQRAVAEALRGIAYGETVTYGELAALAGAPGAARAAGTFCARNRLGVLIPCHRVVAAGGIGGYGSLGQGYKRRLLQLEAADLP
jgi:methylated-DNA-[protein]-cysteine S-methyltransferase